MLRQVGLRIRCALQSASCFVFVSWGLMMALMTGVPPPQTR